MCTIMMVSGVGTGNWGGQGRDDLMGRKGVGMHSRHVMADLHGWYNIAYWELGECELRGSMV